MTQAELKKLFTYDAITGEFTWLIDSAKNVKAGSIAGARGGLYVRIVVNKKKYAAHRLAFLYMTGSMPGKVDHEDGNKQNNIWTNLRDTTTSENNKNKSQAQNNTSGCTGVAYVKHISKWQAKIGVNYKSINLGFFVNESDAIAARKTAEVKYGFHRNHGRK